MDTILFDLDGTLLPMDQDKFIKLYFKSLCTRFTSPDFSTDGLIAAVEKGTKAMVINDGSMTNEQRFWNVFSKELGEQARELEPEFLEFYRTEFNQARQSTKTTPLTAQCIQRLTEKDYTIVIATNPLFPKIATHNRIGWAGFSPDDVSYITTYENSSYCKPNLDYYREILAKIGKTPNDCMMVGNDVTEDMCVTNLGMECYLVTDCLINTSNSSLEDIRQGSMDQFAQFIETLPDIA